MQNASKVANGYKTILTNLMTKDLEDQFNEFGLTMKKQNGEMKDSFTILKELSEVYQKLGTTIGEDGESTVSLNDKMNKLLKDIGGAHNINVLTSGLSNFNQAINASNTALDSAGSAQEEYAIALDTIDKKLEGLQGEFQRLVVGDGVFPRFLKILIDSGTVMLKFANSDVGQVIIKVTLLTTTLNLLNKGFTLLVGTKLGATISLFKTLATSSIGLSGALSVVSASLKQLTIDWLASPFGMVTVAVAGVYAVIKVFDHFHESVAEAQEKLREANQEYQTATKNITSLEEKLADVNKKIAEINSKDNITVTDQEQLSLLQSETKELEYQLAIEKEKARLAQIEAEKKAEKVFGDVVGRKADPNNGGYDVGVTRPEAIEDNIQKMEELSAKKEELQQKIVELTDAQKTETDEYKNTQKEIESLEGQYNKLSSQTNDFISDLDEAVKSLDKESDLYKILIKLKEDYADVTEDGSNAQQNSIDNLEQEADQVEQVNEGFKNAIDSIADLGSAYNTLSGAVEEYNNTGAFSLDTLNNLLSLSPEYLSLLEFENGQLSLNEEGLYALANARINEAEVEALHMAQSQMTALANGDLADSEIGVGNASIIASGNISTADGHIINLGIDALNSAEKMNVLMQALAGGKITLSQFNEGQKQVAQNFANQINTLETFRKGLKNNISGLGKNTGASKRNTGAHKKNTGARKKNADATKAQTEALKKQKEALQEEQKALESQIKDYEIVIDYVKDLLKEEKEAVEEAKEAELDAIDEKIEALEEEQEAFEKDIEAQIDALENQRDEQEKYWNDQIDAIKNANKELEENIRLQQLQEALARAKTQKVKVLKGGRFVYAQDEEAISKAEQELADYEQQLAVQKQLQELEKLKEDALNSLDKQIEELNNYRDKAKENYEQQLKDLQDHREKVEDEYNYQLQQYDAYAKQFDDMLNASAKRHAEILYNELVGEQGTWDKRMEALNKFVNDYDSKKGELDRVKSDIENIDKQIKSIESNARNSVSTMSGLANEASGYAGAIDRSLADANARLGRWKVTAYSSSGGDTFYGDYDDAYRQYIKWSETGYYYDVSKPQKYAKGTYSLPEDQIALVADSVNPSNRELVVGAKINRGDGVLGNFQKGTGIIPHGQTLTENLVNLARWSQNGGIERITNNNSSNNSRVINIENINLPQITNGEQFIQYLENNFLNDSIQFSNLRK